MHIRDGRSYLQYGDVIIIVRNQNRAAGYQGHRLFVGVIRNGDELPLMATGA